MTRYSDAGFTLSRSVIRPQATTFAQQKCSSKKEETHICVSLLFWSCWADLPRKGGKLLLRGTACQNKKTTLSGGFRFGAAGRIRTADLILTNGEEVKNN